MSAIEFLRDDFNELAGIGPDVGRGILGWAVEELPRGYGTVRAAPSLNV